MRDLNAPFLRIGNFLPPEPAPIVPQVEITPDVYMTEWVLPRDANALGNVFGGVVASWIDIAGVAVAQRHARSSVVTVAFDPLHFINPIRVGWMATIRGWLTRTGRTSMDVEVVVDGENLIDGTRVHAAKAKLTYVAIDAEGQPKTVPPYVAGAPGSDPQRQKPQF